MLILFLHAALAASPADIPFKRPTTLALPVKADLFTVSAQVESADCDAAAAALVAAGQTKASEKRLQLVSPVSGRELEAVSSVACTTKEGKKKTVTTASLSFVAVRPGTTAAYAPVSADRVLEIFKILSDKRRLEGIDLTEHDGMAVLEGRVELSGTTLNTIQMKRNQRAAWAFNNHARDLLIKEAPVLRELPELGAISTTVKVKSENFVTKKEKRKEFFRFVVPSEAALQFALGEITDQELVDAMSVFASESRNKGYTRIEIDVTSGSR